jgi:hypothetical protein
MSKHSSWKGIRPDSTPEIESALLTEKELTARWYERVSGQVAWSPGEREMLNSSIDEQAEIVKKLMREQIASGYNIHSC